MKMEISKDLSSLQVSALGEEVPKIAAGSNKEELEIHTFEDPVLLTDTEKIYQLPATKRDAVVKLYEFPERTVEYDDVSVYWSPNEYPGVWAPSIDTMLFAKAIRNELVKTGQIENVNTFLEIGTGSGFLGKYIIQKKLERDDPIELAHLTDINKDSIKSAIDNLEDVKKSTLVYYTHTRESAELNILRKYDLVIANPPYIPRPQARNDNPYEGLMLYKEMAKKAEQMLEEGGLFITNISSLSKETTKPMLEEVLDLETLETLEVPLKVPIVTSGLSKKSREWIEYLRAQGGITEDEEESSGHRFWHTIEIVAGQLK